MSFVRAKTWWVLYPIIAFGGFAIALGPLGSVQVWYLATCYYAFLAAFFIVPLLIFGRKNQFRPLVLTLRGLLHALLHKK